MKHETLGDIVLSSLEEHKPTQGKLGKLRDSIGRSITKHPERIIYGSAAVMGITGYLLAPWAFNQLKSPGTYLLPDKIQTLRCIGAISLALADFSITTGLVYRYAGARIYSKTEYEPDKKHQKIGKFFRYPKILGFGLGIALTALRFPRNILPPYENKELVLLGSYIIAMGGTLSTIAYALRDIEHQGKQGWKNMGSVFLSIPAKIAGITSTDKKISMLERIIEKNDSLYLKFLLASTLQKKSLYESLNYSKEVLDQIKNRPGSQDYVKLKKMSTGIVAKYLFRKKQSWIATFDLLKRIQKIDNEAAKTIVRGIRKSIHDDNLDERLLLDYFSKDFIEKDHEVPLADFVRKVKARAEKDKNIKRFASSEAINVWVYTGSKLIGRSVVIKEYGFDFFERFLKQKFEYQALRGSGIKTEHPLVFMREGEASQTLVTWQGDSTLAGYLRDKDEAYKEIVFKKIIYESLLAQKVLYDKARETDGSVYFDTSFGNEDYSVKIEELDLINQLRHRAFLGNERRGPRWGDNKHLDELMNQFRHYLHMHYHPLFLGICQGDFSSNNLLVNQKDKGLKEAKIPEQLTGKISRIDSRHWVTTVVYDPVHGFFSPCFNQFEREKAVKNIFESLQELYDFNNPETLQENFNCLYPLIGTGLSAYYHAHDDAENAAFILEKVLDFSKDKPFIDKLWLCLKDSGAKPLLKII